MPVIDFGARSSRNRSAILKFPALMPPIINAQQISKQFGAAPLFEELRFTVSEGDRIGLIGPNGSGKSTLLRVLAGELEPDSGEVATRKLTKLAYVEQQSEFSAGETVRSVIERALVRAGVALEERERRLVESLGRAGFERFEAAAASLSGGWRKRLAIVAALVQQPHVLLLDEPTNHLDLEGIEWLEEVLLSSSFACVVISHDRYFLENVATETVEMSRAYPDGLLRVPGNYTAFLEKKEKFLHAQVRHQEALENRVRNEIEWLRRGAKARTRKAKARIDKANALISELGDLNERTRTATADIDFSATERKTKRLIELQRLSYEIGGRTLFRDLDFLLTAGKRVGLVGPNGSGKTTLLRLLKGDLQPVSGEIRRAEFLRIVYFDQNRPLPLDVSLRRALAPESDSVVYQDRVIHVAGWASRFLFTSEQLNQPVSRLSGGERARVLIAQLMLQPADVLLLDGPTNDLDIPTLEILEEALIEFSGALVLVTHDRYMLDRISNIVLGLDGAGHSGVFADYPQWEAWMQEQDTANHKGQEGELKKRLSGDRELGVPRASEPGKKKLSYMEAREYSTLEQRIADAEEALRQKRAAAEDPAIASDAARLLQTHAELEQAQKVVDELYARWTELENKLG